MPKNTTLPEIYYLTDDGVTPNSPLPVVIYRQVTSLRGEEAAKWFEEMFFNNGWSNSWRNGIYSYHHYHSTTHEVLGIYGGQVLAELGGTRGEKIPLKEGDVVIIPAGVGHKNIDSKNLGVVGAYPNGLEPDLLRPSEAKYNDAKLAISLIPKPEMDPVLGVSGGISELW
jgi:uncharacterized protein YjlB